MMLPMSIFYRCSRVIGNNVIFIKKNYFYIKKKIKLNLLNISMEIEGKVTVKDDSNEAEASEIEIYCMSQTGKTAQ